MSKQSLQLISITTGTILRTIGVLLALGVVWVIKDIILLLFIAFLLAGVMYPFVRWMAAHRMPKGVSVLLFYFLLLGFLTLSFVLLIPAVAREIGMLAGTYSQSFAWLAGLRDGLQGVSDKYPLVHNLQTSLGGLQQYFGQSVQGVLGYLTTLFGGLAGLVVVLVLSFYLIVEESAVKTLFRNLIPNSYQELVSDLIWKVINSLGDWLRGQLILGLIIGALYFIAYAIIGVPYPILLALFGGLLEFIPYVGPFIAAVPALILAASVSPLVLLLTVIAIVVIQQLENNLIVPKIMQRTVGLNPIISILAVMIGAQTFGVVGALFAIPVATATSVVISELLRRRQLLTPDLEESNV
ncbi:AI-2E family transporter [Patescibacteria group bacterium]|nr:AI-2E family transporter [Patescibacteria group bacterium]